MGQAYSSDRQPLGSSFEGTVVEAQALSFGIPVNDLMTSLRGLLFLCWKLSLLAFSTPESSAYSPRFGTQATLAVGGDKFDNPTATLLFTVQTVERWSRQLRVVGFACLPVFVDSKTSQQPLSKNVRDYVLNKGAFQIPIHTSLSPATAPFRGDSLESSVPRVPCASLLVRILSPEMAKQQRRQPQPVYTDRVYDSTRAQPTPVERKLYPKYLARKPLLVREAARIITAASQQVQARVAQVVRAAQAQQREAAFQGSTSTGSVIAPPPPPPPLMTQQQSSATGPQNGAFRQSVAAVAPATTAAAAAAAPSLPNNDEELLDWIETHIRRLIAQQKGANVALNYNFASEYFPDLGFFVAIDGAMRIPRNLPSAALTTFAPPGSFYQDNPVVDDLKATLEYDMTSYLSEPRWMDGLQLFLGVGYETGLCVLVDVRLLVPATGSSAPAGWSVLPVFERGGPFVASGAYHLPLFKGVPSWHLIREFQSKGDVDKVIEQQYTLGKLKLHEECSSVLVRVVDHSQAGIQRRPATAVPIGKLRLPEYARVLPPKHMAAMQKEMRNKTYTQAKPPDVTADS
ncbi:hypothetical protein DUNSADRAFT_16675 [Dunaliella salina]|uniref:Uncharacterized protein n=1 Tax=Dunaliella salina TaxID=3046 RepID=A0ABQ7H0R0_DUNSA|nr:hypothetical protein DUNSADRAFT_16675 [Dunaliella salina]|eukprot:KAF5840443.1 hypothetical protein DUNSADRAFT_16675 [Dunaliella salina]